jgi:hypothetical protein
MSRQAGIPAWHGTSLWVRIQWTDGSKFLPGYRLTTCTAKRRWRKRVSVGVASSWRQDDGGDIYWGAFVNAQLPAWRPARWDAGAGARAGLADRANGARPRRTWLEVCAVPLNPPSLPYRIPHLRRINSIVTHPETQRMCEPAQACAWRVLTKSSGAERAQSCRWSQYLSSQLHAPFSGMTPVET